VAVSNYTGNDILGNVDTLVQDYGNSVLFPDVLNPMNNTGNRYKKLVYDYDLVSGKVNQVTYQHGNADAFYHTSETPLKSNDMVMLFTDGLYEVQNAAGDLYSQGMLIAGVQRRMKARVATLFDDLLGEIKSYSQGTGFDDDVCLVGMEVG